MARMSKRESEELNFWLRRMAASKKRRLAEKANGSSGSNQKAISNKEIQKNSPVSVAISPSKSSLVNSSKFLSPAKKTSQPSSFKISSSKSAKFDSNSTSSISSPTLTSGFPVHNSSFDDSILYDFQKYDVEKIVNLYNHNSSVALNFNEMGLGKTVEAIAIVNALTPSASRILVVCPKSLVRTWQKEIEKYDKTPSVKVRSTFHDKFDELVSNPLARWFIVPVDTFRNEDYAELISGFIFDFVIFDEAHHMRNIEKAAKAKGMRKFLETFLITNPQVTYGHEARSVKCLFMTGTPVVNEATDIFPLLHFASPTTYPTFANFKRYHCLTSYWTQQQKATGFIRPNEIREFIANHGVQNKKVDVLESLPPKLPPRIISLEMDDKQREVYEKIETSLFVDLDNGESLSAPGVLAKLIRLRQICLDPKLVGVNRPSIKTSFFEEFVDDMGDRPFVVYTTFAQYAKILAKVLEKKNISYGLLTGEQDSFTERPVTIEKFQNGELQVVIGTITAGGEGVTLTRASDIMLMDRWWTPASNSQAVDRIHRITQTNPVTIHIPQCEKSIDQYLDKILEEKQEMIQSVSIEELMADQNLTALHAKIPFVPISELRTAIAQNNTDQVLEWLHYSVGGNENSIQNEVLMRMMETR